MQEINALFAKDGSGDAKAALDADPKDIMLNVGFRAPYGMEGASRHEIISLLVRRWPGAFIEKKE